MSEVQKILDDVACKDCSNQELDEAKQALYDLLMEKMPKEITERETTVASLYPGHAEEIYNDAQGYNRAVKKMATTINELFGRTE